MEVEVVRGEIQSASADAIVVNLFQGVESPLGATGAVDAILQGRIADLVRSGDFKGKLGEVSVLHRAEGPATRVLLVGLGPQQDFGLDQVRRAAAAAARAAGRLPVRHLATIVHGAGIGGLDPSDAAQATVEGTVLAAYSFRPYKRSADDEESRALTRLTVVALDDDRFDRIREGAEAGIAVAEGVALARDLANHPSNVATPGYLAERATQLAERHGMRVEIWDRERIAAEGMGALAAVARGSDEEPRFIVLEHAPAGAADAPPYVMVGKGLTFDSGGISIKPGLRMGAMKYDMAGGAAVLGAMEVVGRLALPLHVYALVAATENMPGGHATKPGDIVTALNGLTIEILNTDAEGRLVLADALSYASRLSPAAVVDVATLTGAIVVALGPHAAGLFPNDDDLAGQLESAAVRTSERLWRFPMWREYGEMVKSDVADLKNVSDSSPSPAGSIFGGKFLERFTSYPWAHVDIAGMAWDAKDVPYLPKGATGFGVRLLVDWLRDRARS